LTLAALVCAVTAHADIVKSDRPVTPRGIFESAPVASPGAIDLLGAHPNPTARLNASEHPAAANLTSVPADADAFDLLAEWHGNRPDGGALGVRRFILLVILFGAALHFLTSPAFYAWAADVFDPRKGF